MFCYLSSHNKEEVILKFDLREAILTFLMIREMILSFVFFKVRIDFTLIFEICVYNTSSDLERIREGVGNKLGMVTQYLTTFVVGMVVGLLVNWQLTLCLLPFAPILIGSTAFMAKVSLFLSLFPKNPTVYKTDLKYCV